VTLWLRPTAPPRAGGILDSPAQKQREIHD